MKSASSGLLTTSLLVNLEPSIQMYPWNYWQDMSYEECLMFLKWPTLQQRRLFSSLTECYKTINRLNRLDPSAFFTFAHDFWPLGANQCFKLKFAFATSNSFKHSFFIRIIDKWNNLPKKIAEAENLNTF